MVKTILMGAFILIGVFVRAQQQEGKLMAYYAPKSYIQPGMIEASATLSPGMMLNRSGTNYYLSGFAAVTLDQRISLRSDNYFLVSAAEEDPFFNQAFRSYFGAFYHFRPNGETNWDKYIGFQPGIAYMKRNPYYGGIQPLVAIEEKGQIVPSFSLTIGTSFYVWKYFNFFANLSYVNSNLSGVSGAPLKTDELIFSAGLGFQIQTLSGRGKTTK
jgi:hypothetical protein